MRLQEQTAPKPWQRRALALVSATPAVALVSAPPSIQPDVRPDRDGGATGGLGGVRNDMLFGFNKAEIKPEAAQTLDKLQIERQIFSV